MKREKKKLLPFELWGYRRLLEVRWVGRKKNEEVLRRVGVYRSFPKLKMR